MKHVYDDGGRSAAGYDGKAGDCVCRSVAIATGLHYRQVYDALATGNANQRKTCRSLRNSGKRTARNGINVRCKWFKDYMAALGWRYTPTMGIGTGCKVHLADGELPMGRLIVQVSRHFTAVIDGVIHDTHDPSRQGTRCVYGYWSEANRKTKGICPQVGP